MSAKKDHAAASYAKQESLITQAKAEYAKLHPKSVVPTPVVNGGNLPFDAFSLNFAINRSQEITEKII